MITFTIPGKPQPKQRPRVRRGGWTYTPKETAKYEALVRECCPTKEYYSKGTPISLTVRAYFPIPQSWSKEKKSQALNKLLFPTSRPDVDNLEKIIADSLNNYVYDDDSQIVTSTTYKMYSDNPRVEVEIKEINNGI